MEVSALKHPGATGAHARSPLLRLHADERLVALVRRGNQHAFETLVSRYQSRLLSFCRHMLASKEDAEDVLQEVFAAAYNAMLADERPINVRPWLYRIARNRSLNHLRKATAIGMDSMDIHLSEHGLSTADRVHRREEFRQLLTDVQDLPETQRTALLLREIDALSYDQISEVMETTVPSVKSLLVRARVSLAEAAEARLLTCEEVREELGEVAEGLQRTTAPVRRHMRTCERCQGFRKHLRSNNKALAAIFPVAPLLLVKKLILTHLGTASAAGGGSAAAGGAAGAAGAAAGGVLQASASAVATKAVAGLAAAAIVTAGAVEVNLATGAKSEPGPSTSGQTLAAAPAAPTPEAVHSVPQPVTPAPPAPVTTPARAKERADKPERTPAPAQTPAVVAPEPTATASPETTATTVPTTQPTVTPTATSQTQHDGDTTTLPSDVTGEAEPAGGQPPSATPTPSATPGPPKATATPTPPKPSPTASPAPPKASPTPAPSATGTPAPQQTTTTAP